MNFVLLETNKPTHKSTLNNVWWYAPGWAVNSTATTIDEKSYTLSCFTGVNEYDNNTHMLSIYDLHFRISQQCKK